MKIFTTSVHEHCSAITVTWPTQDYIFNQTELRLCCVPLGQNTKSNFWYHVHQLLEELPRRLPEGGDDLVQVVVANPLLEHLLQAGKDQPHRDRFGFCIQGASRC